MAGSRLNPLFAMSSILYPNDIFSHDFDASNTETSIREIRKRQLPGGDVVPLFSDTIKVAILDVEEGKTCVKPYQSRELTMQSISESYTVYGQHKSAKCSE